MKYIIPILSLLLFNAIDSTAQLLPPIGNDAPCGVETSQSDINLKLSLASARIDGQIAQGPYYYVLTHHVFINDQGQIGVTEDEISQGDGMLNEIFNPMNIFFVTCIEYHQSDRHFYDLYPSMIDEVAMYINPSTFNVFHTLLAGIGSAYAYYPWQSYNGLTILSYGKNQTSTYPHEMGHLLGLIHTHGGSNVDCSSTELVNGSNCQTTGDLICDTPADPNLFDLISPNCSINYAINGCPTDANGQAYQANPYNIMSYAYPTCRTVFTPMQIDEMNYWAGSTNLASKRLVFSSNTLSTTTNQSITGDLVYYSSMTINSGAEVFIDACATQIDYLTITEGSELTIN